MHSNNTRLRNDITIAHGTCIVLISDEEKLQLKYKVRKYTDWSLAKTLWKKLLRTPFQININYIMNIKYDIK